MVKEFKDVNTALNAYDIALRDYKAAGGVRPCDQELKQSFLSSLPEVLQRDLVLKAACLEPYEAFRQHIRSTIAFAMQCQGRHRGRGAHLFEPEAVEDPFAELEVTGGVSDELLAFMREFDKSKKEVETKQKRLWFTCGLWSHCGKKHKTISESKRKRR